MESIFTALEFLDIFDMFSSSSSKNGHDSEKEPGFIGRSVLPWMHFPETYTNEVEEKNFKERDDVWSDFHLFHGEWIEIMNKKEWYDAPHVPQIYEEHKKIVKQNMGMSRPYETFYYENLDDGEFESNFYVNDDLPSGNGKLRLDIEIASQGPPSGENDACGVEYFVRGKIKYDSIPDGISFLPRFLAYPLNRFFKWAYLEMLAEEQIEYDGEFAQERINEYFQYIRKYHGEEPLQAKSRQAVFKPAVKEGVFFQ